MFWEVGLKMGAENASATSVTTHTRLHDVTTQKNVVFLTFSRELKNETTTEVESHQSPSSFLLQSSFVLP
jgi:hypothetical protein